MEILRKQFKVKTFDEVMPTIYETHAKYKGEIKNLIIMAVQYGSQPVYEYDVTLELVI